MNIWHHSIFFFEFEKKIQNIFEKNEKKKIIIYINVGQTIDNLLCNLKK